MHPEVRPAEEHISKIRAKGSSGVDSRAGDVPEGNDDAGHNHADDPASPSGWYPFVDSYGHDDKNQDEGAYSFGQVSLKRHHAREGSWSPTTAYRRCPGAEHGHHGERSQEGPGQLGDDVLDHLTPGETAN